MAFAYQQNYVYTSGSSTNVTALTTQFLPVSQVRESVRMPTPPEDEVAWLRRRVSEITELVA